MKIKRYLVFFILCIYLFSCAGCGASLVDAVEITNLFDMQNNTDASLPDEGKGLVFFDSDSMCMFDMYAQSGTAMEYSDWLETNQAQYYLSDLKQEVDTLSGKLAVMGIKVKNTFTTLNVGVSAEIDYADAKVLQSTTNAQIVPCLTYEAEQTEESTVEELLEDSVATYADHKRGIVDNQTDFKGDGMLVAVLDTGLRVTHSAFSKQPSTQKLTQSSLASIWKKTEAFKSNIWLASGAVYNSAKIPFAFDYVGRDANVSSESRHGTHVAGIIAGNNSIITGVASECQLAAMKVFNNEGRYATFDTILSALSDCLVLGVDVVNMSLGSPYGLSKAYGTANDYVDDIYQKLFEAGIIVCGSAGNSHSNAYKSELGVASSKYVDTGIISSSASYMQNYASASCDANTTDYIRVDDKLSMSYILPKNNSNVNYTSIKDILNGETTKTLKYIKIGSFGVDSAYTALDVSGKVVVVNAGGKDANGNTISYLTKISTADKHGAAACIIIDEDYIESTFKIAAMAVPTIMVDKEFAGSFATSGSITFDESYKTMIMSDFSSWGCVGNLFLKPDITSYGGSVYSSGIGSDSAYVSLSGTSMSSPNTAGIVASLKQYLQAQEAYKTYTDFELANVIKAKVGSSASLLLGINGNTASVRQQGAGLANLSEAVADTAYLTSALTNDCKLELGDDKDKTGIYTLSAVLHNQGTETKYKISAKVMTAKITPDNLVMTSQMKDLDCETTIFVDGVQSSSVTTSADIQQTNYLRVKIELSQSSKDYMDKYPHGIYVEGYLILTDNNQNTINIPWLAFYGDWGAVPSFDMSTIDGSAEYIGAFSVYSQANEHSATVQEFCLGDFSYDTQEKLNPLLCSLSTQQTGMSTLVRVNVPLLRSTPKLNLFITTQSGAEIMTQQLVGVTKCLYDSDFKKIDLWNVSVSFDAKATYKDVDGMTKNLKDGDIVTLTVSTELEYSKVTAANRMSIDIYIDSTPPTFDVDYFEIVTSEGKTFLKVKVSDNFALMAIKIFGLTSSQQGDIIGDMLGQAINISDIQPMQQIEKTIDITDNLKGYSGQSISVMALDYAHNYTAYKIVL